ncbi:MAG: hypothetical protein ACREDS_06630 [Limisphaerales bacterium]
MTRKNWVLIIVLLALAGIYAFYFTDWFKPKIIQISHTSRVIRRRFRFNEKDTAATLPVIFGFDHRYKLTEIKVVPLTAWQTNKNALPIWHLVSNSGSAPVENFIYGQNIRGMKPEVSGAHAAPLQPNVTYHLFVKAGSASGQHDFKPVANPGQ